MTSAPLEWARPVTEWFEATGVRRRYPPQSYLFHEQDRPHSVMLVETGLLRIERTTTTGRRLLLDVATRGDLVGELAAVDDTSRSTTAVTIVESRLLVVNSTEFSRRLAEDAAFTNAILLMVVGRLRELSDQLVEATSPGAAGRVAARLITLIDESPDQDEPVDLALPFSQEELAQWAGLSREGAVKGLRELREAGILETARQRMTVHDVAALRRRAAQVGH